MRLLRMLTNFLRDGCLWQKNPLLIFTSGIFVGCCLLKIFSTPLSLDSSDSFLYQRYQRFLSQNENNPTEPIDEPEHKLDEVQHDHPYDNETVANQMKKEVRILCWVMTNPTNHKKKAIHVKRTWGKRCNILLFMSSETDNDLPTVKLDVEEGRQNLWRKVKEAFKYVYKHHYNDADWFYKADDDTYAIIENLRYMLYPYNPETPVHFGYKFKPYVKQGYMSGGSGYVLSKEALRRFVEVGIPDPNICLPGTVENEDIEVGKCMENLNVTAGDSRDFNGRGRMFPFTPEDHLFPNRDESFWYWEFMYYKTDDGLHCCSDNAIAFHYIGPNYMYVMDYMIYHLKPFGIAREPGRLPDKLGVDEYMPAPLGIAADSLEDSLDDDDRINVTTPKSNTTDDHNNAAEVV